MVAVVGKNDLSAKHYRNKTNPGLKGIFISKKNGSIQYTSPEIYLEKRVLDYVNINLAFFSLSFNIIVVLMYLAMKKRMKRKSPNYMLFNQAIVDMIIGVLQVMYPLPTFMTSIPDDYFIIVDVLERFTMYLGLGILLFSSAERFIAIRYPLLHKVHITRGKLISVTMLIWLLSGTSIISHICSTHFIISKDWKRIIFCIENSFILIGIIALVSLLVLTYREIHLSIESRINTATEKNGNKSSADINVSSSARKQNKKVFRIFLLLAISYTLTYFPLLVCNIVLDVSTKDIGIVMKYSMIQVTTSLYTSSALVNPIITLFLKRDFHFMFLKVKKKFGSRTETTGIF